MVSFPGRRSALSSVLFLAIPSCTLAGEGFWTSTGPDAAISAIAVDPQAHVVLAAGRRVGAAVDSIFTRSSSEVDWTERAQASPGVTLTSLAVDPSNPTMIYAGGDVEGNPAAGAIYVSRDAGLTWSFLHLFPKSPVYSVVVDPSDSSKIYAGGSVCTGGLACSSFVSRSVDAGNSWTSSPTFAFAQSVGALVIDPNETSHLYAATDYGLLYSGDSAATWTAQFGAPGKSEQEVEITCIAISPSSPGTIYVGWHTPCGFFQPECGGAFGEGGAAVSRNGGGSWTYLSPPIQVDALVIKPADSKVMYVTGSGGVFKSADGALTWSRLGDLPGAAVMQLDPVTNVIYVAGSPGVFEYEDNPLDRPRLVLRERGVREVPSRH